MFAVEIGESRMDARASWRYYLFPIGTLVMAGLGSRLLPDLLPLEPDHHWMDLFGLCFLCVWICVVLGMGVVFCMRNPLTLTVDASGVRTAGLFGKRSLTWDEIRDYGFAYYGRGRGCRYYSFYFADSVLKEKSRERKRLRGRCVSICFEDDTYLAYRHQILALCARYSRVKPFTADPEKHSGVFF